jgi:hypothetical protein
MLALVEAQNAATLARFNDARLAGHRDVVAAFYDRGSGDIDAHVGLVTPYQLWRFENGLDPREAARNAIFVMAITVRGLPQR